MHTIEIQPTEDDLDAAFRLLARRSRRLARLLLFVAALLAGILVLLVVSFPDARHALATSPLLTGLLGAVILMGAIVGALLLATPRLRRLGARRTLAENPAFEGIIRHQFDDEIFAIETAYSKAAYPWSKLHGWREDADIVLVLLTRQLFYVIPKRQISPPDLDALRERLGPELK